MKRKKVSKKDRSFRKSHPRDPATGLFVSHKPVPKKKLFVSKRQPSRKRPLPSKPAPKKKFPVTKRPPPRKPVPKKKFPVAKRPLPRKPLPKKKLPAAKRPLPCKPLPKKKLPVAKRPLPRKPLPKKKLPVAKRPLPRKPLPKKKLPVAKRPLPCKPLPKKKLPVAKRPLPRKPKPKKPPTKRRYPTFMARAAEAETIMVNKLGRMMDALVIQEPGLGVAVKSFINTDGTVDGELRIRELPDVWRTVAGMPDLVASLSEAARAMGALPKNLPEGGAYWVSHGLRFGPKDMREIEEMAKFYKRFRGLFQIGAHHTTAESLSAILNNALTIRMLVERVWEKRDLPPAQLLVRIVWTPDGVRPGRFAGEEGSK